MEMVFTNILQNYIATIIIYELYEQQYQLMIIHVKIINSKTKFHLRQFPANTWKRSNARQPYFLVLAAMATKMKGRVTSIYPLCESRSQSFLKNREVPPTIEGGYSGAIVGEFPRGESCQSRSRRGFTCSHDCPCIRRQIANAEITVFLSFSPSLSAYWHLHLRVCIHPREKENFYKSDVSSSLFLSPSVSFLFSTFLLRIVQSKFQRRGLCKWQRLVLYTVSVFARLLSVVIGVCSVIRQKIAPRTWAVETTGVVTGYLPIV